MDHGRQWGALPEGVIPVAARDPFTRLELLGVCLEPPDELLRRGGIAQVNGGELEAAVDEVGVPVREPGHDEPAPRGQHLRLSAHVAAHRRGVTDRQDPPAPDRHVGGEDRKSTRLNSSHLVISYAVFCLKKKKSRHTVQCENLTASY